ncbi:sensor histidine kinase [Hespellia stercorisuis]|uniref:histidine kinase n=1 Tax=Hespellia stercorisuis DSM 15480 TaxID=1121950 RepID=A0A1M6UIQ6_9FIRM|nr:HAMP domain-containing sensor histidine kinase [Hespellia stercorisuis]SHK69059.1 His Kinase A (phospho-acceptor) domain-containing protein [Hespellia stercorisuis DSM 15480]
MFENRTMRRLDQMLNEALDGTFCEENYDETQLSKLEARWKHFLGASVLSAENTKREKENVKSLVSDISHQTKTPMTNIKLYASLLEESLEKEQHMEHREESLRLLGAISGQAEKLEFLIQSLTKLSRLESNVLEVAPGEQQIGPLLSELCEEAGQKAEKRQVRIQNLYRGCGMACYDRKWTREALGNILDNAVKYSKPGGTIRVDVREYELYAAVSVEDDGIGIREEEQAKIFGRFYRSEAVQQEDGVGIGLYLAREIAKRQNGYIKVKSEPGAGSEFLFYLRRK